MLMQMLGPCVVDVPSLMGCAFATPRHGKVKFSALVRSSKVTCPCRRFCAHPGELSAARRFCVAAQERLLRSVCNLGPRLPKYIRIAASVHTDIDMFIYSQPSIEEGAGES